MSGSTQLKDRNGASGLSTGLFAQDVEIGMFCVLTWLDIIVTTCNRHVTANHFWKQRKMSGRTVYTVYFILRIQVEPSWGG